MDFTIDPAAASIIAGGIISAGGALSAALRWSVKQITSRFDDGLETAQQAIEDISQRADRMESEVIAALRAVSQQRDELLSRALEAGQ